MSRGGQSEVFRVPIRVRAAIEITQPLPSHSCPFMAKMFVSGVIIQRFTFRLGSRCDCLVGAHDLRAVVSWKNEGVRCAANVARRWLVSSLHSRQSSTIQASNEVRPRNGSRQAER